MTLQLDTAVAGGHVAVTVHGEIDIVTGPQLRERLVDMVAAGTEVVVDMTDVTFLDSTGLQALVATRRRADLCGGRLRLRVVPHGPVHRVLELTGTEPLFVLEQAAPGEDPADSGP